MNVVFSFLIAFVLVLTPYNIVRADSPSVEIEVDHVANVLEKFKEKVTLFFKFSNEAKIDYQKYLLEKRLAELKYVVDGPEWDPVEETSSRYATYVSKFSESAIKNASSEKKVDILNTITRHEKIIEALQRNFEYDGGWWLLLQHDRNLIKMYSDKLK